MVGEIVICMKGNECGQAFYVIAEEGVYLSLANGKRRTLERPKRKKRKHTVSHGLYPHEITERLQRGEPLCNRDLRRALAAFRDDEAGR